MSVLRLLVLLVLIPLALSSCAEREGRLFRDLVTETSSFVDPGGLLTVDEIDRRRTEFFDSGASASSDLSVPAAKPATVWMKIDEEAVLRLAGPNRTEPIVVLLDDNQIREAELWLVKSGSASRRQIWKKLNEYPQTNEDGFHYPVFLVDPVKLAGARLYLSLRPAGPVRATPCIADFQTFAARYDERNRLLTLVLGVRIAVFAYILALGLSLRSATNLWLAGIIGVGLGLIAAENTLFDLSALPGGAALTRAFMLGGLFALHFCLLGFATRFLRLHLRASRVFKINLVVISLLIAATVAGALDGAFEIGIMHDLLPYSRVTVLVLTVLSAAAIVSRSPSRAIGFLLGWAPVMGAVLLRILQDFAPHLAPEAISDEAMMLGITLSLALFAVISSIDLQRRESRLKADVQHSAERFKAFAEIGTDASWEVDASGRISFVAGSPSPLPRLRLGEPFVDFVERATSAESAAPVQAAIAGRLPFDDLRLRLADGRNREAWISLSGRPILDRPHMLFDGSVYRGLIRDVSDEVERESRRLIEQQVFALGQLAGSVAHEINNLIHPIINLTKRLRNRHARGTDPEGARMLDLIDQSSRQAARVASELLQTMRGDRRSDVRRPLPLALEQALEGIRPALPSSVEVELDCEDGQYPPVRVGDMLQVLSNLVSNAVHAMDGHGRIRIGLSEDPHGAKITVADDGRGMEEHVRLRALQPFFSTKTDGRGTGVGLYIVQRIIGDYDGQVAIASSPGAGTCVTIFIPNPRESVDE